MTLPFEETVRLLPRSNHQEEQLLLFETKTNLPVIVDKFAAKTVVSTAIGPRHIRNTPRIPR